MSLDMFPGFDPDSEDDNELVQVFFECFRIYKDRQRKRGSVWRRSGMRGMVFHVQAKAERAFFQVMRGKHVDMSELYDIINYSAFAAMLKNNRNGDWPWPD